ncbi:PIN2/TERF1-interacting telomerase inhibitor 1 [Pseudoliparis swirei]|uniref:PIN2/TERF1-interacting telomerase inhibitor 1 n=1 Tax=Pseudoliparis swirei TaxID=2059687 RepID=UPI0024BE3534|nr:PIN2/TERF1-interacting telomerase inhibitor 1 [Pseudoliparis swirei]
MSMLAEPRKKQKWSVDPRIRTWSKDESNFGQKMMERMGWSKGKGLGRSETGPTEAIIVKRKNDRNGLGRGASQEDNWISHQDDFNELLAELNNCHGQNNSAEPPPPEEPKGFSLEEKSKTSKKRIHYMKFTKGKDLSSCSETDLNCIFGKRGSPANQQQGSSSSNSKDETQAAFTSAAFKLDAKSITNTVKSTLTMQQYFAQRMALMKKGSGPAQSAAPPMETDENSAPSDEPIIIDDDDSEELKKKKKKSKKSSVDLEVVEENSTAAPIIIIEEDEDKQQEPSGEKKKRKVVESDGAAEENCDSTSGVEQNSEVVPPPKKKKKKKKLKKALEETELLNGHVPTEDQTVESEVAHKKRKKRREELDDVVEVVEELDDVVEVVEELDDVVEVVEELVEKKLKKDKNKNKKPLRIGWN